MSLILQLCLCFLPVIQLTSSQHLNMAFPLTNVCSGSQAEQILSVLSQLAQCCNRTDQLLAQLQRDVADIKSRVVRIGKLLLLYYS